MGTTVAPAPLLIAQFLNNAGQMNAGGTLLTQVGGVNYPTFQDAAGSTPLPNPIPLNSRGEISNSSGVSSQLFLANGVTYTITLFDALGNQIWVASNVTGQGGAPIGTMTDEKGSNGQPGFSAANGDFVPGTTATLTLSVFYGSASNLWVAFDGVEQGADTYALVGNVLTFVAPIPVGTLKVYVKGGTTATIGTPGNGTVGPLQIETGYILPITDLIATYHMSYPGAGMIPVFRTDYTESLSPGGGVFVDGVVVNHTRTNGNGHRQAFTGQITTNGANVGEFQVGVAGFAFLQSGSGSASGVNGYAQALSGSAATAEIVGAEFNTDVQTSVTRKAGLQIVDVATSTSDATSISAGLIIETQVGGVGWQAAIQFGADATPNTSTPSHIDLMRLAGSPGSVSLVRGIDFRAGSFSGPAIDLPPNSSLAFGGGVSGVIGVGGTIQSVTNTAGPVIEFGASALGVYDNGITQEAFAIIANGSSSSVSVYIPTVGLRQIQAGAANSGGAGFRQLIVSN